MPLLTNNFYTTFNVPCTNIYIETGTYLGNGIKEVINNYDSIHSIELSQKWYEYNKQQFESNKTVNMHFGDSKKVLPVLLESIKEPVTIFLDAHYSGTPTAFGEESNPLLHELDLLKSRNYNDIIIIDDCRMLGVKGVFGAGENHPIYPNTLYDWSDITEPEIIKRIKDNYILLKNNERKYTTGPEDQFILVKPDTV